MTRRLQDLPAGRVRRNIGALAGGQLVTWTMTLLWTFVVPRALGPRGMGLIVSGWAVAGVLGVVLGLGTRNYLVREMVVTPTQAPQLMGTALVLRLALAPLFAVSIAVYTMLAGYSAEANLVLYLAAAASFVTLLAEPMQAGFQAVEQMKYLAFSDVVNKSAQGLFGIALALVGVRAVGITACWLVVSGLVLIANVRWIRPLVRFDLRTNFRAMRHMVRKSAAYWAFGLFFMVYLWIDSVMLSLMTRPEVVGWYGVPTKLFQSLMFLPVIVSTAWLPRLVAANGDGADALRRAARTPVESVLVLSLPVAALTAALAQPVVTLLYGPAYSEAVPVMVVLGLCIPPMYLNIMLSQVLVAAERQVVWTWAMAGATVVNPIFNLGLIRFTDARYGNGAIGAAWSLLLTELLVVTMGFALVGVTVLDRRSRLRCLRAAVASALAWAAGYVVQPFGLVAVAGAAVGSLVVAGAALRVLTRPELDAARGLVRRLARRAPAVAGGPVRLVAVPPAPLRARR